jgi:hypothetical protein
MPLSLGKIIERFMRVSREKLARQPMNLATEEAARDAMALFQVTDELYNQRRYHVQSEKPTSSR